MSWRLYCDGCKTEMETEGSVLSGKGYILQVAPVEGLDIAGNYRAAPVESKGDQVGIYCSTCSHWLNFIVDSITKVGPEEYAAVGLGELKEAFAHKILSGGALP